MRLITLQARNFRNFDRLELECGARFNILVGNNGQGKTNILESIYVLGQLRSFRGVGRAELTRWGAEVVSLQGTVEHPARSAMLTLGMSWNGQRRVLKVQGREIQRTVDYLGHLNVLVFAADSVQVIKGSPEGRRRLLDRALVSLQPAYLSLLQRQQMILKHRNRLLKGPQRDDVSFTLEGRDLKNYGSQGEQRLAVLLILIAMLEDLEAELGTPAIVLLDDMVAELDRRRRGLLWEFLQSMRAQVFISGTEMTADLEALGVAVPETQVWKVDAGTVAATA